MSVQKIRRLNNITVELKVCDLQSQKWTRLFNRNSAEKDFNLIIIKVLGMGRNNQLNVLET